MPENKAAYNRYGMPNGAYAQGAQAAKSGNNENPIAAGLDKAPAQGDAPPEQVPADPGVPVTRSGAPNLSAVPPPASNQMHTQALNSALGAPAAPQQPQTFGVPQQQGGQNPASLIQGFQGNLSPTSGSLDQIIAMLGQNGISAKRAMHANNTLESDDKLVLPDGSIVDLITDVGGPNAHWQYAVDGAGGGAPPQMSSALQQALSPSNYGHNLVQQLLASLATQNALK